MVALLIDDLQRVVNISDLGTPVGRGVLLGIILILCVLLQVCDLFVVHCAFDRSGSGVAEISDRVGD